MVVVTRAHIRQILCTLVLVLVCAVPSFATTVQDDLERTLTLTSPPQRIVSLVPAITETLFALGLDEQIIGVTSFCNYPEAARHKPKVGEYASPNLEVLATMRPDLLFMAADASSPELLRRLEALHIPVFIAYPRSIDDTVALFRTMGRLLDRNREAERLAVELERTAECARELSGAGPRVRVLCTVMTQPLVVAGPRTLLDDLVRVAGGENVVPEGLNRYPTWGIESVLAADPELILVSPHPGQPDPSSLYRQWPELQAVRNERLVTVEADWIQRPGPRLVLGLKALAGALHGLSLDPEGDACF